MSHYKLLLKRCLEYYIDFVIQLYTYNCEKELTYFAKKLEKCLDKNIYNEIIERVRYIDSIKDCMFKRMYVNELHQDLIYDDVLGRIIQKYDDYVIV
jgi:hypothetical protein